MKFQLTDTYRYWWPVTVEMPDPEKPGKAVKQSFTVQFEALGQDEGEAMNQRIAALPEDEQKQHKHEAILRVCKDWRDVTDADGKPVPFSDEVLRQMLQYSWIRLAIYQAYADSLVPGAARKGN